MRIKDEDFVIFDELVRKFPDFQPKKFIKGVIKHRFLRYFPLDDIPKDEIFYIGFQALYIAWHYALAEDKLIEDKEVFIQYAWEQVSSEIYQFIKTEYPSSEAMGYLKKRNFITRINIAGSNSHDNFGGDAYVDIFDALSDYNAVENFYKKLQFNEAVNALFKVCSTTGDIKLLKLYLCGFSAVEIANFDYRFCNRQAVANRLKTIFEKARVELGIESNLSLFLFNEWQKLSLRVNKENSKKTAKDRTRRYYKKNREKINTAKREKRRKLREPVLQPEFALN